MHCRSVVNCLIENLKLKSLINILHEYPHKFNWGMSNWKYKFELEKILTCRFSLQKLWIPHWDRTMTKSQFLQHAQNTPHCCFSVFFLPKVHWRTSHLFCFFSGWIPHILQCDVLPRVFHCCFIFLHAEIPLYFRSSLYANTVCLIFVCGFCITLHGLVFKKHFFKKKKQICCTKLVLNASAWSGPLPSSDT